MNPHDPLEKAFDLLKSRSRERPGCNLDLEARMMREFADGKRRTSVLVKGAALAVLILAVTGAAVAATGGIGRLLNWTGTIESHEGAIYRVEDGKVLDDDGNVIGDVEVEIAAE